MNGRMRMLIAVAGTALVASVAAAPLGAATSASTHKGRKSCAARVIQDWVKNQRLDRRYPIKCYTRALRIAPEDLLLYTSFATDVKQARAEAIRKCKRRFGRTSFVCRP